MFSWSNRDGHFMQITCIISLACKVCREYIVFVFPFVGSFYTYICAWVSKHLCQSFIKVSKNLNFPSHSMDLVYIYIWYDLYFIVWWFCHISLSILYIILRNFEFVWPRFDLKADVGHCDLYFMGQWFYFTFWRQFHVWTTYIGMKIHYCIGQHDLRGMFEMNCLFLSGDFKFQVSPKVLISCPRSTPRG